eukprot:XP_013983527.1 PREDICTED: uncharacterized protein LOC106562934 [Salmo salar]
MLFTAFVAVLSRGNPLAREALVHLCRGLKTKEKIIPTFSNMCSISSVLLFVLSTFRHFLCEVGFFHLGLVLARWNRSILDFFDSPSARRSACLPHTLVANSACTLLKVLPLDGPQPSIFSIGDQGILSTTCECLRGAMQPILTVRNIGRADLECEWRKPAVPNQVHSVEDLYPAEDYNPLSQEPTEQDLQCLRNRLWGRFSGMACLLEQPLPSLSSLSVLDIKKKQGLLGYAGILAGMALLVEQQKAIQQATVGQRTNPNWHTMRRGRLTASDFVAVVRVKHVTPLLLKRVTVIGWGVVYKLGHITKRWASRHPKWLQGWMCRSQGFRSWGLGSWVPHRAVL